MVSGQSHKNLTFTKFFAGLAHHASALTFRLVLCVCQWDDAQTTRIPKSVALGESFADFDSVPPENRYRPAGTEFFTGLIIFEEKRDVLRFYKKKVQ